MILATFIRLIIRRVYSNSWVNVNIGSRYEDIIMNIRLWGMFKTIKLTKRIPIILKTEVLFPTANDLDARNGLQVNII